MSMSRSVSRVVSPEPMLEEDESDESDTGELPLLYMPEPVGQPVLVPDQSYGQPTMSWGYEQPSYGQQQFMQQGYQFPQDQAQMQSFEGQPLISWWSCMLQNLTNSLSSRPSADVSSRNDGLSNPESTIRAPTRILYPRPSTPILAVRHLIWTD